MKRPLNLIISSVLVLLLLLFSCEYNIQEEYILDIEKPDDIHRFDLSLFPNEDTIPIFSEINLFYDINTFGLEIYKSEFSLADKIWQLSNITSGSITIDPDLFLAGFDTLVLKLYTNSGTGSLADEVGAESYYVEKKWKVLIDINPTDIER